MDTIRGTVKAGRLELNTPRDWPDGTEVLIEPVPSAPEVIGIDESDSKLPPLATRSLAVGRLALHKRGGPRVRPRIRRTQANRQNHAANRHHDRRHCFFTRPVYRRKLGQRLGRGARARRRKLDRGRVMTPPPRFLHTSVGRNPANAAGRSKVPHWPGHRRPRWDRLLAAAGTRREKG